MVVSEQAVTFFPELEPVIKTPQAHHKDQLQAFPGVIETTYGPLALTLVVSLRRRPRQRCSVCGKRRIGFAVGIGDQLESPVMCAQDAGLR